MTFTSSTTSVCTVSGASVTFVSGDTCTINADQGGNASRRAAAPVMQSFTVAAASGPTLLYLPLVLR